MEVAYISKVEDRTYVAVVQLDKKAKTMTVAKAMKEIKEYLRSEHKRVYANRR